MAAPHIQERVDAYLDLMLERVEMTKYPSKELLDRIEQALVVFYEHRDEDS